MLIISLITFILLSVGIFLLMKTPDYSPAEDVEKIMNPQKTIRRKAISVQRNQKEGAIMSFVKNTQTIMMYMNMGNRFIVICAASVVLTILSFIIAVYMNNIWLAPALILVSLACPFLFIRMLSYKYTRHLQNELEMSLSQITISYMRMDDISKAVEENLDNIRAPLKRPFEEFLNQIRFVDANERNAIQILKEKINDEIFNEWCNDLLRCIQNRNMKYLLQPTLDKYSTLRKIENKIKNEVASIKMQFYMITGIVFMNYPIVFFIDKEWYAVFETTVQGHICVGLVALITAICAIALNIMAKPIKYKI